MFHIIWMMIIGLIVGALAKLIMPGRDPGGIVVTMLWGLPGSWWGAFLAGWLACMAPAKDRLYHLDTRGDFAARAIPLGSDAPAPPGRSPPLVRRVGLIFRR